MKLNDIYSTLTTILMKQNEILEKLEEEKRTPGCFSVFFLIFIGILFANIFY